MAITSQTPRCNAIKASRPEEYKGKGVSLPRVEPGIHAGEAYCGRPAGEGTNHLGEGRCFRHFGNMPVGPAHPQYKHGGFSKYVPKRWQRTFDGALDDPLAQREQKRQLAIFESLQVEAMQRLAAGDESGEAWAKLQEVGANVEALMLSVRKARDGNDEVQASMKTGELLATIDNELLPIIEQGAGEEAARRELVDLMQKRSKLIRVQQQGERTVPVEVLGVLVARIAAIISEVITKMVPDRVLMRRLLSALITRIRIEGLPPGGDGMMKRVDAHTAREGIDSKLKEVDVNGVSNGAMDDSPLVSTIETTGRTIG